MKNHVYSLAEKREAAAGGVKLEFLFYFSQF